MMTLSIMRGWYGHLPIPLYNLLTELMSRWSTMLETIEGQERKEPRDKPPYPTEKGLWGCPTLVNNIETLYIQHASVTSRFPALKFNYAFLDGFDTLNKYITAGPSETKVFLTGTCKFDNVLVSKQNIIYINNLSI